MNREQMVAWLMLEGWTPFRGGRYFTDPGVFRGEYWCYLYKGNVPILGRHAFGAYDNRTDYLRKDAAGYEIFTDDQIQLIYQEIIKHGQD